VLYSIICVVFEVIGEISHVFLYFDIYIYFYFYFFTVYRLVSVGTIEEITYARQVYKQQMGEIGLHGGYRRIERRIERKTEGNREENR
jgi:hypothetical protein